MSGLGAMGAVLLSADGSATSCSAVWHFRPSAGSQFAFGPGVHPQGHWMAKAAIMDWGAWMIFVCEFCFAMVCFFPGHCGVEHADPGPGHGGVKHIDPEHRGVKHTDPGRIDARHTYVQLGVVYCGEPLTSVLPNTMLMSPSLHSLLSQPSTAGGARRPATV